MKVRLALHIRKPGQEWEETDWLEVETSSADLLEMFYFAIIESLMMHARVDKFLDRYGHDVEWRFDHKKIDCDPAGAGDDQGVTHGT